MRSSVGVAPDGSTLPANPNPLGSGLRQSAWEAVRANHVAAAKPKARSPMGFLLCGRPCLKSLSGYGEARGIRRKRKRRPDCTFPTTLWLEARRAQRMQAQNRSAPDASGGSSPPGSAAGSRAVQDGAMCRKALMVVQHAVRRLPEGNLSGSIQTGEVLKVALERPKALACPSVS